MRLGVVTGLSLESSRFAPEPEILVASGAGPETRGAAERLLGKGAEALLGFGLAGGLDPAIRTGSVVVATEVRSDGAAAAAPDRAWRHHLEGYLGRGVRAGVVWGADRVLVSPEEKRAVAAATGAIAVDTESHHLAAVAVAAGRPFAVVRVAVDRFGDRLPPFVTESYDDEGRLRIPAVLMGLMRRPSELPALLRLTLQSGRALQALGRVGRFGAALGPPL